MKKFIFIFLICLLFFPHSDSDAGEVDFVTASADSVVQNILPWQTPNDYRRLIPLNGDWSYRAAAAEDWSETLVPSAFQFRGKIIFKRSFNVDSTLANHFFRLACYGINYYCEIFINDKFVGSHDGGYAPFSIDLSAGVIGVDKENIIEIKVDTQLDSKTTIPLEHQPFGVKNTFGIFRSLYLLALPEVSIENLRITDQLNADFSSCELNFDFEVMDRIGRFQNGYAQSPKRSSYVYQIEVYQPNKRRPVARKTNVIDSDSDQLAFHISETINLRQPMLWSPSNPALYRIKVMLKQGRQIVDVREQLHGIKQLDFYEGHFYLNSNRFFIKGINWVEQFPQQDALLNSKQLLTDLTFIKKLNANAVRVLNFPPHPFLSHLCDSLGLFVFQEIPLQWIPSSKFKSEVFQNRAYDYLQELIEAGQSHVSNFAYGIGSQFLPDDPSTSQFLEKIYQQYNPTDEYYFYTLFSPPLDRNISIPHFISGISIFNLKKEKMNTVMSDWLSKSVTKPNIVFNFGAPKFGDPSTKEKDPAFQKYQVLQIVNSWKTMTKHSEIDGCFYAALSDFYGNYPSSVFGYLDDKYLRPHGLMDINRESRYAFEALQSIYQQGNCSYNPNVVLESATADIFPLTGLVLIILFLIIVNRRRYFRENFKRIFVHPHGFYTDIRDGRKIPAFHTVLVALFISFGSGLVLASLFYFFKDNYPIDHLLTLLIPAHKWKALFCDLIWKPWAAILGFTLLSLTIFILIAVYVSIAALITRKKVTFGRALIYSFWAGGNYLILIPLGMVLFRVLKYQQLVVEVLIVLFLIDVWYLIRLTKGLKVIFTWTFWHAALFVLASGLVVVFVVLYFYETKTGLLEYVRFYLNLYGPVVVQNLF